MAKTVGQLGSDIALGSPRPGRKQFASRSMYILAAVTPAPRVFSLWPKQSVHRNSGRVPAGESRNPELLCP